MSSVIPELRPRQASPAALLTRLQDPNDEVGIALLEDRSRPRAPFRRGF